MHDSSRLFKGYNRKPGRIGSGINSNLILFDLKEQRKQMACEKGATGWTIKGSAAAPGVTQGLATVITCNEDLLTIKPDTILVYPHASPVLTPVLPKIKGLVTDTGGLLTPAATIAREHGIPVVVGTSTATDVIDDGDVIRVDGTNGRVMIIARAQKHASDTQDKQLSFTDTYRL
jgi:phosphoenolpyruvate synthase/pyruvate phosphate dikinase